jgi:hypothetical protein
MHRAAMEPRLRTADRPAGQVRIQKPAEQLSDQTRPNGEPGKPANATTGQGVAVHDDEAKDQPEVATGEDLNGPPRRFAPSKTPE